MASRSSRAMATATLLVALAACGGGEAATTSTAAPSSTTTTTEAATGAVNSIDGVQEATIQIVAQGTFRDPAVGFSDGSGLGSGFIISSDGLAVTNNHVVAGAATLEVFVGGDTSKSYNATIVGVSECNDLALIDINESDPLPYLEWYSGEITAGLDVYAAGYPLGDPEFTLTRGIVSKAKAGGDLTGTSSIDHTLEHDANIQPGNSGGPLVTSEGKVVAINYAGGAIATTTAQFFAIAFDLAVPVIDRLRDGDFESLGINGWAVSDDATGVTGIWIAGIAAGSPASKADLLPGDIITSMNGLPVGTDGTFKDYCDVIRTAGDKPIAIEVLRFDSSEVLRGEINGDEPIELDYSFASEIEDEVEVDTSGSVSAYSGYQSIVDDTGTIRVDVPYEWFEIDTEPGMDGNGNVVPFIAAAPSLSGFYETYNTPGLIIEALEPGYDIAGLLVDFAPYPGDCSENPPTPYSDAVFVGQYQVWDSCGGTDSAIVVLAAVPDDGSITMLLIIQLTSDADMVAIDQIFATFDLAY